MKKRLTVTVDAEVIPAAKRRARALGVSLSSLVERSLRELAADGGAAGDAAPTTDAEWEARRAVWFESLRRDDSDEDSDKVAAAWAARWRAWFSGELPPPRRSKHPRYRYLDEGLGESYGVRWTEDDEPLPAEPPSARKARQPRVKREDDDWDSWLEGWLKEAPPTRKLEPPTGDDPRYEYYWYKYRLWEGNEEQTSIAEDQPARATR